jgi:hypothetical protein
MKKSPKFYLNTVTLATSIGLVSQLILGFLGSQPVKAQSTEGTSGPIVINCLKVAGNTPVTETRIVSVAKKVEASQWSLKAYPNFFHLFSCRMSEETNLSALDGSFAIPDDSTLLQAQVLFYTEGKLAQTVRVNRDEVKRFSIPLSNIKNLAIEYRFIGGGSYDYLHALNWQYK